MTVPEDGYATFTRTMPRHQLVANTLMLVGFTIQAVHQASTGSGWMAAIAAFLACGNAYILLSDRRTSVSIGPDGVEQRSGLIRRRWRWDDIDEVLIDWASTRGVGVEVGFRRRDGRLTRVRPWIASPLASLEQRGAREAFERVVMEHAGRRGIPVDIVAPPWQRAYDNARQGRI